MDRESNRPLPERGTPVPSGPISDYRNIPVLPRRQATLVLAGIMLGILMGALDNLVVVTALPKIVNDIGGANTLPFVVSAYLIAATVATPIFGKLSDNYSRRNFFILGLVIFIGGSLLAGLSQSSTELIAFRAIQGFGSGAFFPIGISIIGVLFTPEARAKLTGAFSSIFGIATILGPFLGSYIVDNTTWRWVFYVNLPIGIAGIIIVLGAVGVLRPTSRKRFDTLGSALLAGWVSAFMLALLENSDSGWAWSDARIVGLLGATVILFIGFVLWELEDKEPVVPLRFFAQRVVSASSSIAFLRGTVLITVSTFVSILVAYVLGGTPDAIRDTLYFFVIPLVIGSLIGGQLLPRLTYRVLSVTGMALMSVGTLLLTTFRETTPTWQFSYLILPTGGLGLYLIPTGFGVGMTFAVTALAIQYAVPPKDIGAASSLVQFLANLGGAVGLALFSSYAQGRITSLDPVPTGLNCPIPPASAPNVGCFPYYSALPHAMAIAYSETFYFLVAVSLVAFVSAWFITGRLPKTRGMPMPGTGSGSSLPSGTAGGAPSAVSGSR